MLLQLAELFQQPAHDLGLGSVPEGRARLGLGGPRHDRFTKGLDADAQRAGENAPLGIHPIVNGHAVGEERGVGEKEEGKI